jgi:hypothetical protein
VKATALEKRAAILTKKRRSNRKRAMDGLEEEEADDGVDVEASPSNGQQP